MEPINHIVEYLIIAEPNSDTGNFTVRTKQIFESAYGCLYSSASSPHITIAHFLCLATHEQRLLRRLKVIAASTKPPEVAINGFGHFEKHTIFLNVTSARALIDLGRRVEKTCRNSTIRNIKSLSPSFTTSAPHLTIARGMTTDQFNNAWTDWSGKSYKSSFQIKELVLLRRIFPLDNATPYAIECKLSLTGWSDSPVQAKLPY